MIKLLLPILLASSLFANEFRQNQKIEEIDVHYKDIKYLCIGGTLSFIRATVHNSFIIKSVENPRTNNAYKCELVMNDPYSDDRMIVIKD